MTRKTRMCPLRLMNQVRKNPNPQPIPKGNDPLMYSYTSVLPAGSGELHEQSIFIL